MLQGYLNLGHTKGRRGHPLQLELTQLPVAAGHPALPSIDDKGHVGLVVMHSGEDLLAMARHSQRGGNEHMLLVPNHGNADGGPLLGQLPSLEHVLVGGGPWWAATRVVQPYRCLPMVTSVNGQSHLMCVLLTHCAQLPKLGAGVN